MKNADLSGFLEFLLVVGRLKRLPRTGWLDRGMPPAETESVADHSFRVALIAWLMAGQEPDLDRDRVLKLAVVHDLAEAITGDLTPYDPDLLHSSDRDRTEFLNQRHVASPERSARKKRTENAAFMQLTDSLHDSLKGELRALWQEMAEKVTPESQFVKEADRIETYLQSIEYLKSNPELPMESFRLEIEETIATPSMIALRAEIRTNSIEK